ncbi:MAG: hypothetical protein ABIH22_02400 [Candidatus Margulisiibacteriota bacterium]
MTVQEQTQKKGPNFKALGLKSPMEVIDILALLKIDGEPVIKDDNLLLNPKLKAHAVMEYYEKNFNVKPNDLPYLASLVKHDIKRGKIGRGKQ